jgi:chemotaxis protein CheC
MEKIDMNQLWKIGEAGIHKASEALSKMTESEIGITNLSTRLSRVEMIIKFFNPDEIFINIFMPLSGDRTGYCLVIFDIESAQNLINLMMKKVGNTTITSDLFESSLKEISNILAGAFLTALANMSDIKLIEGTPTYSRSMVGASIEHIIADFSQEQQEEALAIEVGFVVKNVEISAHLYVILESAMIKI